MNRAWINQFNECLVLNVGILCFNADGDAVLVEAWALDGEYYGRVWIPINQVN